MEAKQQKLVYFFWSNLKAFMFPIYISDAEIPKKYFL